MAFAQKNTSKGSAEDASGGVDVSDELHALGGGGPLVVSSAPAAPQLSTSSYPCGQDPSFVPPPNLPSSFHALGGDTVTLSSGEHAGGAKSAGLFPETLSMTSPFNFTGVDFSSHIPGFGDNVPTSFDEIFQTMTMTPTETHAVGSTILDGLGLGEDDGQPWMI